MALRLVAAALLVLAACGGGEGALDKGDPLHSDPVKLPPPELGLPPTPKPLPAEAHLYPVPKPPFSEGIFPCSRCHVGSAGGEPDSLPAIPHKRHLDRDLACADCHGEKDPKIPAAETCYECHDDIPKDSEGVRAYFAAVTNDKQQVVFPRRWKTRDTKPSHEAHAKAGVACASCHGEPSDGPFVKPKSVALMDLCLACHEERKGPKECASCHAEIRDPMHKGIVLHHAESMRCFECHDEKDRDQLHLVDGRPISFDESYVLCGQCHGEKFRDWKAGIHGKRTGMWNGAKEYLLCAHCHYPHDPRFRPIKPLPPPVRPEELK